MAQAFAAWLRLASGVSAQDLVNQPLTKAALDGLNEQATFDAAVDAVCELIRYTVSGPGLGDLLAHMPLVQVRRQLSVICRLAALATARLRGGRVCGCASPTFKEGY